MFYGTTMVTHGSNAMCVLLDASFAHGVSQQLERVHRRQCSRSLRTLRAILNRVCHVSVRAANWTRIGPNDTQKKLCEYGFGTFNTRQVSF